MRRILDLFRFAITALVVGSASIALGVELEQIRVGDGPNYTRVVLDLSAPTTYQAESLGNPPRFYIDLDNTTPGDVKRALPVGSKLIKQIRTGFQSGGRYRVVLDLKNDVRPTVSFLKPNALRGHRVVIDLLREVASRQCSTSPHEDVTIMLDAGHGGEDPGAIAVNRVYEKRIVLNIVKFIQSELEQHDGFRVVLTRSGDYELPLETRRELANQERAHLFVSIHADAYRNARPYGASVYVLSEGRAQTELAKWLEENENRSDWVGGISEWVNSECFEKPAELLFLNDKSQQEALAEAVDIGKQVLRSMAQITDLHPKAIDRKSGKYVVSDAGFSVLKATSVPSLLIETGFLSNPREAAKLATSAFQRTVAKAIAEGIRGYFCANPPWHTNLQNGSIECRNLPQHAEYRVQRGDTLSEIALRHNTTIAALRAANNLRSDRIRIGQILVIQATD